MDIQKYDSPQKDFNDERLLSAEATAEILGCSASTLAVWRSTKRYALRYIKVGRIVKYRAGDVRKFISSRAHEE